MCGFVGFLSTGQWSRAETAPALLERMAHAIVHRGPDSAGYWHSESGIALGHRRLSILDLSTAGAQPMESVCGRYIIAFNGEIYNHLELRKELKNSLTIPNWRGHSDTETLLNGFTIWGIRRTVERCIGMFAFSVWDKKLRRLTLARDRLGEKPLYYGWQGDGQEACFLFGSDLAALKAHPSFAAGINRNALALYMRHNCVPAPYSIYQGIYKLPPGHLLSISLSKRDPDLEQYWSLPQVAERGIATPFTSSDSDTIDALETLLKDAIAKQMLADVPLGAFLSGGIDSSTIVALMQAQSSRPVKTFSIGFNEEGYNEAVHAKAVAQHLGTDHTELYVSPQQAIEVIQNLPRLYSEPFADSSQIPTYLVSHLARRQVTVSLSGDAGDELFSGYNRYILTRNLWSKISRMPHILRIAAAASIHAIPPSAWSAILSPMQTLMPPSLQMTNLGEKLHKGAAALNASNVDHLYFNLISHWEPDGLVLGAQEPLMQLYGKKFPLTGLDSVERMMALDTITYLPDDILVKVDRAAMGVSLETRVPFLDHRVVEFAWRIPLHMKLRNGAGKWILRQVLYRHVPKELIERPKMGFGIPIDSWLRGPLRDWAENLLDESRLRQEGYLNPIPIRQKWQEHTSGKRNWHHHLWDVLMFQAWLSEQNPGKTEIV